MASARHPVLHTPEPRPALPGARMGHHQGTTADTTSPAGHPNSSRTAKETMQ